MITNKGDNYRFGGIERLYGKEGLKKLQDSHVTVVGIGGVGSWVVESLARSGVGKLRIIDLDEICLTNTNRQIHTAQSTLGQSKVEVMAKRARDISPSIQIEVVEEFITDKNINQLMEVKTDIVIDAIDSVYPKAALLHYCLNQSIDAITTGASGGKWDPSKISYADLGNTHGDALLHRVRKILKKQYAHPKGEHYFNLLSVFSPERVHYINEEGELCHGAPQDHTRLDCHTGLGSASFVTGSFGFCCASLCIKKLLGYDFHVL